MYWPSAGLSVFFKSVSRFLTLHAYTCLCRREMMLSKGLWPKSVGSRSEQRLLLSSFVYSLISNVSIALRECMDIVLHVSCLCMCISVSVCVSVSVIVSVLWYDKTHSKNPQKRSVQNTNVFTLRSFAPLNCCCCSVQYTLHRVYAVAIRIRQRAQTHDFDYIVIAL